jgi:hypothetical protein
MSSASAVPRPGAPVVQMAHKTGREGVADAQVQLRLPPHPP